MPKISSATRYIINCTKNIVSSIGTNWFMKSLTNSEKKNPASDRCSRKIPREEQYSPSLPTSEAQNCSPKNYKPSVGEANRELFAGFNESIKNTDLPQYTCKLFVAVPSESKKPVFAEFINEKTTKAFFVHYSNSHGNNSASSNSVVEEPESKTVPIIPPDYTL